MTTNQEGVQAAVRTRSGSSANLTYNGDWHYLWDVEGIANGTFNERMLAWINLQLVATYINLNEAKAAYAISLGFSDWSSMDTITTAEGLLWGGTPLEWGGAALLWG